MFLRLFTIMLITASLKVSAEQVYLDTEVLLSNSGTIGISAKLEIISVTVDYDKEIILISVNNPNRSRSLAHLCSIAGVALQLLLEATSQGLANLYRKRLLG